MSFVMNFIIVSRMLVCSSFLISVCMFIVSIVLLISSITQGSHLAMVLINVCSAVTV